MMIWLSRGKLNSWRFWLYCRLARLRYMWYERRRLNFILLKWLLYRRRAWRQGNAALSYEDWIMWRKRARR